MNLSTLLEVAKRGCDVDVQVRMGKCSDPTDQDRGWEKILVVEAVGPGGWSIPGNMNVFQPADREMLTEELSFTGENLFEIVRMVYAEQAASNIVQEVVKVLICDSVSCGDCELPSDGCQKVFVITKSHGGSPGLAAEVIYSQNQGVSWSDTLIDSIAANEDPVDAACVGSYLVVLSNEGDAHHYASIADILNGVETWEEVTGYNASGSPNAMWAFSPLHIWVVGDGGYVYKLTDITATVAAANIQDAGDATTENLVAVHGYDELNIMAVGANNAVVYTTDGETWAAVTGPNPGTALTCCWMKSKTEWFVGDAGGQLWYTRNSGTSWTEKTFPSSGTGSVEDIQFANDTVGFLSHSTAAVRGRILRTINGGFNWYVAPESNTSVPLADKFNSLAVCEYNANLVFAGGLGDNAVDGILVKGIGT
jgi:photosystem II stability/assembly factor-like uncharacterized protein